VAGRCGVLPGVDAIGERALAWIAKYRLDVRPDFVAGADSGALFLNELGEALAPSWLTINTHVSIQKLKAIHTATDPGAKLQRRGHEGDARQDEEG
jgi:hypothetical protein